MTLMLTQQALCRISYSHSPLFIPYDYMSECCHQDTLKKKPSKPLLSLSISPEVCSSWVWSVSTLRTLFILCYLLVSPIGGASVSPSTLTHAISPQPCTLSSYIVILYFFFPIDCSRDKLSIFKKKFLKLCLKIFGNFIFAKLIFVYEIRGVNILSKLT